MKMWIVTAVDYGETCDGKARTLGAFKTRVDAKNFVDADIQQWIDQRAGEKVFCDFDKMKTEFLRETFQENGCEWNIEEIDIDFAQPLPEDQA